VKTRLDVELARRGLATSRSQAENAIRLGQVEVDGRVATKAGQPVQSDSAIRLLSTEQYVSRAGLKLASVASGFKVEFQGKVVLDVGSSTGGFTDYALQHGAERVIAVDVGTDQLHPSLRADERVELYEKTDIRDFQTDQPIDIIVCDVSFISLREILPHVARALMGPQTVLLAMVKISRRLMNDTSQTTISIGWSVWKSRMSVFSYSSTRSSARRLGCNWSVPTSTAMTRSAPCWRA
jgi:23S rRNA (cytidine1920-2'-O)/16S rRNA (cytidine1409-2'-O)-methyltransferase